MSYFQEDTKPTAEKNRGKVRFLTIKPLFFNDFYELGGRGAAMWVKFIGKIMSKFPH